MDQPPDSSMAGLGIKMTHELGGDYSWTHSHLQARFYLALVGATEEADLGTPRADSEELGSQQYRLYTMSLDKRHMLLGS